MSVGNQDSLRITGIVPPMVTPLLERDRLDVSGLERLIEHIIAGGCHALFILGTTGEAPSLNYATRREMVSASCRIVAGRVPVLVGVTDTSFSESISLAAHAADRGADAAVIAPPYYFPAGQPELLEYYQCIISAMPLPVMLYNMPGCTKINIELDTLRHLLDHPKMIGIKDSSGQMTYFHRALRLGRDYPGKSFMIGTEEMLGEAVLMGAHGSVCGGANLFPELYVKLYNAARKKDAVAVERLHRQVMAVTDLYRIGRHGSSNIKGIKCALSCMGICEDFLAEPFHRFREQERNKVRALLAELTDHTLTDIDQKQYHKEVGI